MARSPRSSRRARVAALAAVIAIVAPASEVARAQRDVEDTEDTYEPFERSRVRGSVVGGVINSRGNTYLRLGAGVGYYLVDGLELGLDADIWTLDDPTFLNVVPGLRYVFRLESNVMPYAGTFYRHAFVFGEPDLDSLGARAGIYVVTGRTYVGAGAVYEHWLACDSRTFVDCDSFYPELALAVTF